MKLAFIHRFLDRSTRPTYVYERVGTLLLEAVLLVACAAPAVTGWRSALIAALVGALRLYETELRREDASVMGRHRERGLVLPLPPEKVRRAAERDRALQMVTWTWPGLTMILLAAAETGSITSPSTVAIVATVATLARAAWARGVMPAWRRSRCTWRALRKADETIKQLVADARWPSTGYCIQCPMGAAGDLPPVDLWRHPRTGQPVCCSCYGRACAELTEVKSS